MKQQKNSGSQRGLEMEVYEKYLTDKVVEEITGIKRQTLANARHLGHGMPYLKVGRSIRYKLSDVLSFMERHRIVPEALRETT